MLLTLLCLALIVPGETASAAPAMRGSYVIGRGGDFRTIGQALLALERRGIDRPVVLRIRPGTYREILRLGPVSGASSSRGITIRPFTHGGSVLITQPPGADTTLPIMSLDSTTDVTITSLSFFASGPARRALIQIIGSRGIVIENNIIRGENSEVRGANNSSGILLPERDTAIVIRGNRFSGIHNGIQGGYYPTRSPQQGTNKVVGLRIEENSLENIVCAGILLVQAPGVIIRRNRIVMHSLHLAMRGIELTGCRGEVIVSANRIDMAGHTGKGVSFQFSGSERQQPALIANNVIRVVVFDPWVGDTQTGIDIYSGGAVDVIHNTVRLITRTSRSAPMGRIPIALQIGDPYTRRSLVLNNILSSDRGFAAFPHGGSLWGLQDYNLLHSGARNLPSHYPESYRTPAGWQKAGGGRDRHSVFADPQLDSSLDARAVDSLVRGRGRATVGVTVDIDGRVRHALHPDIGAFESRSFRGRAPWRAMVAPQRQWRYSAAEAAGGSSETIRFLSGRDTTFIYDQTFTRLTRAPRRPWFDRSYETFAGALREDRIGRVYLARGDTRYISGFTERLLYDFRAVEGDTLAIATDSIETTHQVIVERTDSVRIEGRFHRRLLVRSLTSLNDTGASPAIFDEWIEGIGGVRRPLVPLPDDLPGSLICLKEQERTLYGADCSDSPADLAAIEFYRSNGPPRIVVDSIVRLIVAPEQECVVYLIDSTGEAIFERYGLGPARLCRIGELPLGEISWQLILMPNGREYSGWVRKPEQ